MFDEVHMSSSEELQWQVASVVYFGKFPISKGHSSNKSRQSDAPAFHIDRIV